MYGRAAGRTEDRPPAQAVISRGVRASRRRAEHTQPPGAGRVSRSRAWLARRAGPVSVRARGAGCAEEGASYPHTPRETTVPVPTIAPAAGDPDPFERAAWLIRAELGGIVLAVPAVTDIPQPRPTPGVEEVRR